MPYQFINKRTHPHQKVIQIFWLNRLLLKIVRVAVLETVST